MDLETRLSEAEAIISLGAKHIARVRDVQTRLKLEGRETPANQVKAALAVFVEILNLQLSVRDQLRKNFTR